MTEDKNKYKLDNCKERKTLAWQGLFYSTQRIDLLIISISGAGIYACLETLKYLQNPMYSNVCSNWLLKAAGIALLLAIITNFVSQSFGQKANYEDWLMSDYDLDNIYNPCDESEKKIQHHDTRAELFSGWTRRCNYASMALMAIGLTLLILTYLIFF
ncbi:hypothetical protein [Leeuwenhoekiella sp. ZYFB001]|uniref:hypothetical protein n=1 Tax=Leeuwenhoekiella sp. ZYFB001 TaxID=2719912 RepID=UPI0014313097|nr:hypothetical protein [Leeuwenhoekiella sp. ZYFB001]